MSEHIEFKRRAQVATEMRGLLRLRHWLSTCGQYRVTESTWLGAVSQLPDVFIACRIDGLGWTVIKRCRTRTGAEKACRDHSRNVSRPQDAGRVSRHGVPVNRGRRQPAAAGDSRRPR